MKPLHLLLALSAFLLGCRLPGEESCVDCRSVALRVKVVDAEGAPLTNAVVMAINARTRDTVVVDSSTMADFPSDSAGLYAVYGGPGTYTITIRCPGYATFSQGGIAVSQWDGVTCDHAETEHLVIELAPAASPKGAAPAAGRIVARRTGGSC